MSAIFKDDGAVLLKVLDSLVNNDIEQFFLPSPTSTYPPCFRCGIRLTISIY